MVSAWREKTGTSYWNISAVAFRKDLLVAHSPCDIRTYYIVWYGDCANIGTCAICNSITVCSSPLYFSMFISSHAYILNTTHEFVMHHKQCILQITVAHYNVKIHESSPLPMVCVGIPTGWCPPCLQWNKSTCLSTFFPPTDGTTWISTNTGLCVCVCVCVCVRMRVCVCVHDARVCVCFI